MKKSSGIALVVFMTTGALTLGACDQSDCKKNPDQSKCQQSGSSGGGGGGGGGGKGSASSGSSAADASHGVSTGGFGESAGGHGGGGGE